jgi:uncharacterized protein (DUF362 family)/NAD-dependent dihydropyrimidine dehydrogenase PreA subunit
MEKVVAIQTENNDKLIEKAYNELIEQYNFSYIIKQGDFVLIKPNLVAPFEKATTDARLLELMIKTIVSFGGKPIIAESSGFEFSTEITFKMLRVDQLCKKYNVPLVNLDLEEFVSLPSGNQRVPEYLIPKLVLDVQKIINMPRLKGHSLTKVTFAVKNLFGLLHRTTRRKIHATDLELGIAKLAPLVQVDFVLVDGLWSLGKAVYSDSSYQGILIAGTNIVNVDIVCCKLFGMPYQQIPHINMLCGNEKNIQYVELGDISYNPKNLSVKSQHFINQNKRYKVIYTIDLFYSFLFKKSIIPFFHYFFGIRPCIIKKICRECGRCMEICPTGAIKNKRISIRLCMNVRCFHCIDICKENAIVKRGFHNND